MSFKRPRRRWHAVKIETLFSRYIECRECARVTRNQGAMPLIHKGRKP